MKLDEVFGHSGRMCMCHSAPNTQPQCRRAILSIIIRTYTTFRGPLESNSISSKSSVTSSPITWCRSRAESRGNGRQRW